MLSVWFFLFFARKPMMLFGISGLVMAASGVLVGWSPSCCASWQVMPPFGFRPLLYLVILLEVLGFLLFGFGFIAELVAQQHAELDALHRRGRAHARGRRPRARSGRTSMTAALAAGARRRRHPAGRHQAGAGRRGAARAAARWMCAWR
jgi:hypothetical protein